MNITGPASERGEDAGKDWGMEGPMTRADVSVCVCVLAVTDGQSL